MGAHATVIAVVIATVVDVDVAGIVTGIVDVVVTGNASRANMRFALPENYTPIVLPGESISKYRGVEPVTVQEPTETTPQAEPDIALETASVEAMETAAPVEQVL